MGEYRVYRMSNLAVIEMRMTASLVSRGALALDEPQDKDRAIQRRVRELAPKVEARQMTPREAIEEVTANPYGRRQ